VIGERNSMLLHQYGTLDSFRYKIPGTKWNISKTFIYARNLRGAHCYHEPTRQKMLKILRSELKKGIYTKIFFDRIHNAFKRTIIDIKKFANEDFSKKDSGTLAQYYLRYYKIYQLTFLPMMVSIYSSDLHDFFEKELKKVLRSDEKTPHKIIEIISFLLTPHNLTEVQKEEQEILEVRKKIGAAFRGKKTTRKNFEKICRGKKIRETLDKLQYSHGWFHQEYVGEVKSKKSYMNDIWREITKQKKPDLPTRFDFPGYKMKEAMRKQKEFFKTHTNSDVLEKAVAAMREFSLMLDYSKADLIYGLHLTRPFIGEIQKRFDLSWVDVHNFTPDEIVTALKRRKLTARDKKNIWERRKEFAMLYDNGKISIYHGKKAKQLKEKLLRQSETKGVRKFSGLTAMTGKVVGTAKIVTSNHDLEKFSEGDIMITNEVTTELTSILKKAAAIVADGGGIISHTAIVAREFKTPCIVGTKIATKVLKDGDKIEVDASESKGSVKLLSR